MAWTRAQVKEIFRQVAIANGFDVDLSLAQINQESGFNANAVGPPTRYGRAKGAAQFIDDTWRRYGSGSPFDPNAAAQAWAKYMRYLLRLFGSRWDLALAGYNGGEHRSVLQTALRQGKPLTAYPICSVWGSNCVHVQSAHYSRSIIAAAGKSGIPETVAQGPPVNPLDLPLEPSGAVGNVIDGMDLNQAGLSATALLLIAASVAVVWFISD